MTGVSIQFVKLRLKSVHVGCSQCSIKDPIVAAGVPMISNSIDILGGRVGTINKYIDPGVHVIFVVIESPNLNIRVILLQLWSKVITNEITFSYGSVSACFPRRWKFGFVLRRHGKEW